MGCGRLWLRFPEVGLGGAMGGQGMGLSLPLSLPASSPPALPPSWLCSHKVLPTLRL